MGWNTTVVVYNDALNAIKNDPDFGRKLAEAITRRAAGIRAEDHVDVPAGNHANAAMVVESHHADSTAVVTVAGNLGILQAQTYGWDHHTPEGAERVLRDWADKQGFELVKKR